jgi:hypothetical protein
LLPPDLTNPNGVCLARKICSKESLRLPSLVSATLEPDGSDRVTPVEDEKVVALSTKGLFFVSCVISINKSALLSRTLSLESEKSPQTGKRKRPAQRRGENNPPTSDEKYFVDT